MHTHSLQNLAKLPFDGGASEFVGDLLIALSASGVREIWRGNEVMRPAARCLNEALCIINAHTLKMFGNSRDVRADKKKIHGWLRISEAVATSHIGTFDYFWHYVAQNHATWYDNGQYLMPYSPPHAKHILEQDFDPAYRRLVCGYAKLIQRRIYGR